MYLTVSKDRTDWPLNSGSSYLSSKTSSKTFGHLVLYLFMPLKCTKLPKFTTLRFYTKLKVLFSFLIHNLR